jgi:hypothetical protein
LTRVVSSTAPGGRAGGPSSSVGVGGFLGSGSSLRGEGGERQNDAMVGSEEGRKIHNLLPALVGWQEVWNKTKEQSVEQQEVLMLFLFP